jgi:CorA-like Mg2+ transporter protein
MASRPVEPPIAEDTRHLIRRVTEWESGKPPKDVSLRDPKVDGTVRWYDIDVDQVSNEPLGEAVSQLQVVLEPLCRPGLTSEMLEGLLAVGGEETGRAYMDGKIRLLSAFSAAAGRDLREDTLASRSSAAQLVVQPVEFLTGPDWVITCWHYRSTYRGAREVTSNQVPENRDKLFGEVAQCWVSTNVASAADLAVLVLRELSLTFIPAYRQLSSWLEEWELSLYLEEDSQPDLHPQSDRDVLRDLWGSMAMLRDRLNPLNRPGLRMDLSKAWFWGATNHGHVIQVDDRIDHALNGLERLSDKLRSSFGLLHVQIAEEQRAKTESLQHWIQVVGVLFLIPALVVGFYGANTQLPGGHTWRGFWIMIGTMVCLTVLGLMALWTSHRRR